MNAAGMIMLSPLLLLAAAPVVVLIVLAFVRHHALTCTISIAGMFLSFIACIVLAGRAPVQVTELIVIDRFALFYIALLSLTSIAVALLAYGYLQRQPFEKDEFYVLLLLATLGCAVLAASTHFATFFLGLETLSVSLYAMIAYLHSRERGVEAGMKYLILAGVSSAFLLFGMALVYAALGTMDINQLADAIAESGRGAVWLLPGIGLIVIGIGFKLAVVPFHMWTPDVYEGAPAPVSAFIATASKGAVFALMLRYFGRLGIQQFPSLLILFATISVLSMLGGNLLALYQNNVKRLLAYSSIAHLGYLLVAFVAGGALAAEAVTIYLVAYFVTTLAAFGVVTVVSDSSRDRDDIEEYRSLFWSRPILATIMTVALFSLAGIPLTAGFIGKFYILAAGARGTQWTLLIVLVFGSAIGLFYYLRVIIAMFDRSGARTIIIPQWSRSGILTLAALLILLLAIGIYPSPLIGWIRSAADAIRF